MEWKKFDDADLRGVWIHQRLGELRLSNQGNTQTFELVDSEPLGAVREANQAGRGYVAVRAAGGDLTDAAARYTLEFPDDGRGGPRSLERPALRTLTAPKRPAPERRQAFPSAQQQRPGRGAADRRPGRGPAAGGGGAGAAGLLSGTADRVAGAGVAGAAGREGGDWWYRRVDLEQFLVARDARD